MRPLVLGPRVPPPLAWDSQCSFPSSWDGYSLSEAVLHVGAAGDARSRADRLSVLCRKPCSSRREGSLRSGVGGGVASQKTLRGDKLLSV